MRPSSSNPGTNWLLAVLIGLLSLGADRSTFAAAQGAAPNQRTVESTEGAVIGQVDSTGVASFLGVPYASPPTGGDRWKAAAPPRAHPPLLANKYQLPCSQIPIPAGSDAFGAGKKIPSTEDCLCLNLWSPPRSGDGLLPVMVWSHGGQYLRGASSQYNGAHLARLGHVVVVTLGYRLGPLGFLAHPALTKESPDGTSGNQALQDHIQALRWLHANVGRFGGDPNAITLFGESAGSASTCALMTSPVAKGLFHRAILESGSCEEAPSLQEAEAFGRRLAEALGCKNDDPDQELACMRGHTDEEVMNAIPLGKVLGEENGGVGYRFNRDGVILPETPEDAVRKGHVHHMPVMLGTTDNEMARYTAGYGVSTPEAFRALIKKDWDKEAATLLKAYPVSADSAALAAQTAALYADWGMTCPVRRDARSFASAGLPTWLYRFRRAPEVMGPGNGAFHGVELVYLFPSVFRKMNYVYSDDDEKFARLMIGYWSRFAKTGDPNGDGAPEWPVYREGTDADMSLGQEVKVEHGLRRAQCDLWDRIER